MYIFTFIIFVIFAISIYREPRRVINAFLYVLFLGFAYLSLTQLSFDYGWNILYSLLLGFGLVLVPLSIFLSGFFFIGNGIILLRKEGFSKVNLLSVFVGIMIFLFFAIIFYKGYRDFSNTSSIQYFFSWRYQVENFIYFNIIFAYIVFGFSFVSFSLYAAFYNMMPKQRDYDFIIIHGAGLLGGEKPTPLLKGRIDKAIKAFYQGKKAKRYFIASGGQGPDEKISEARAIANYLLEQGFKEDDIILEDKSTTTYENLLFSYQIGKEKMDNPQFLFVTNDYHVLRTSLYAKKIGLKGNGVGSRTAGYYLPSAFIREFIALVVRLKWWYLGIGLFFMGFYLFIQYLLDYILKTVQ